MSRKKRHEPHENHERWLVSYADFITLLFAFFVVMYSVSSVNEGKYRVLSQSMLIAFRSASPDSMKPIQVGGMVGASASQVTGQANMDPGVAPDLRPLPAAPIQRIQRVYVPRDTDMGTGVGQQLAAADEGPGSEVVGDSKLGQVVAKLRISLADLIQGDMVNIRRNPFWIEVEIKNSILFASGSAQVNEAALETMSRIAEILREVPNRIQVEGFTDNVPINTPVYPSNWELSAARAASVVHVLMKNGVRPGRMSAIGYSEYQPIADNSTAEGRNQNRRVVLVVMGNVDPRYPTPPAPTTAPTLTAVSSPTTEPTASRRN
ncbi:MAG: flagellar motor protein MotD [Candidatus Competibacteraceae bacterium]|nr:MAG: flagellar motor protein MotD [Candidatus Competibacteraceae bacterium]